MVSEIFEPLTSVVFSVRKRDTSSRMKKSSRVTLLRPLVDGWSGQPQSSRPVGAAYAIRGLGSLPHSTFSLAGAVDAYSRGHHLDARGGSTVFARPHSSGERRFENARGGRGLQREAGIVACRQV